MADLYYLPTYKTTTLNVAGGIDDSQTTGIILTNVDGVDTAKPGIVCLTYATPLDTDTYELVPYESIDGSNTLVNPTRGGEGSTARTHSNLASVGFVISKSHINNINDKLTSNDEDLVVDPNGNELIKTSYVASAVNEWDFSNSATGNGIKASAEGGDTNIDMVLLPKGTGVVSVTGTTDYESNVTDDDDIPNKAYVDDYAGSTGWVVGDTLVYVSANSVKVEGSDVTTKYKIGTKVKFDNDSTTQYWVVQSVSFSTDTTITFIETDSHTIADSAITNSYYSYQEAPQGWPKYFLYTPTWTGFSSDPTEELEWSVSGRTIFIFIKSGDGTSNSATFDFTLPVSERQDQAQYYSSIVSVKDNGTWQAGAGIVGVSGTTAKVGKTIATQAANAFAGFTTSGSKAVQGQIWYNF